MPRFAQDQQHQNGLSRGVRRVRMGCKGEGEGPTPPVLLGHRKDFRFFSKYVKTPWSEGFLGGPPHFHFKRIPLAVVLRTDFRR